MPSSYPLLYESIANMALISLDTDVIFIFLSFFLVNFDDHHFNFIGELEGGMGVVLGSLKRTAWSFTCKNITVYHLSAFIDISAINNVLKLH